MRGHMVGIGVCGVVGAAGRRNGAQGLPPAPAHMPTHLHGGHALRHGASEASLLLLQGAGLEAGAGGHAGGLGALGAGSDGARHGLGDGSDGGHGDLRPLELDQSA